MRWFPGFPQFLFRGPHLDLQWAAYAMTEQPRTVARGPEGWEARWEEVWWALAQVRPGQPVALQVAVAERASVRGS